jgi:formylglycine-generating enzyme required for sulfatase activity
VTKHPAMKNSFGGGMKFFCSVLIMGMLLVGFSHAATDFSSTLVLARQGDVQAMIDVSLAYYHGQGTLKDPFKAKCWMQAAYGQGSDRARQLWEKLSLWKYSGKCDVSFDNETLPKYARGDVYIEPVTQMRFVYLPRGCFKMGCDDGSAQKCSKDEKPIHTVCLDGFWMAAYEVDQTTWQQVMKRNPSRFSSNPDNPVETVSFDEIETFIQKLNAMTNQTFSLPTEAQWEYACTNGGKPVLYPWEGDDGYRPDANCGNCETKGFNGQTAPVGSFPPNDLGLYDMGGNVKEWCKDVYDKNAYTAHEKNNPEYKKRGAMRVVRGGSYTDNTKKLQCSARDRSIPSMQADNLGFRLIVLRR